MGLFELLITVALIGLVVWLLVTFVPMPEQFKRVLPIIAIVIIILWIVLQYTGFHDFYIGRVR